GATGVTVICAGEVPVSETWVGPRFPVSNSTEPASAGAGLRASAIAVMAIPNRNLILFMVAILQGERDGHRRTFRRLHRESTGRRSAGSSRSDNLHRRATASSPPSHHRRARTRRPARRLG